MAVLASGSVRRADDEMSVGHWTRWTRRYVPLMGDDERRPIKLTEGEAQAANVLLTTESRTFGYSSLRLSLMHAPGVNKDSSHTFHPWLPTNALALQVPPI